MQLAVLLAVQLAVQLAVLFPDRTASVLSPVTSVVRSRSSRVGGLRALWRGSVTFNAICSSTVQLLFQRHSELICVLHDVSSDCKLTAVTGPELLTDTNIQDALYSVLKDENGLIIRMF